MGRHQHILGRGIGWGTSSEAGRRAASAYFTQEYPAEPSRTRIEQRGDAERLVEVKNGAPQQPRGAEGADMQEFRNAVSGD
jgi:hypothetical protein